MSKTTAERRQAFAEAETLCTRLRSRGDPDCDEAAAQIEGTLQAYADLVDERDEWRGKIANLEHNLQSTLDLLARIPAEAKRIAVHGRAA